MRRLFDTITKRSDRGDRDTPGRETGGTLRNEQFSRSLYNVSRGEASTSREGESSGSRIRRVLSTVGLNGSDRNRPREIEEPPPVPTAVEGTFPVEIIRNQLSNQFKFGSAYDKGEEFTSQKLKEFRSRRQEVERRNPQLGNELKYTLEVMYNEMKRLKQEHPEVKDANKTIEKQDMKYKKTPFLEQQLIIRGKIEQAKAKKYDRYKHIYAASLAKMEITVREFEQAAGPSGSINPVSYTIGNLPDYS